MNDKLEEKLDKVIEILNNHSIILGKQDVINESIKKQTQEIEELKKKIIEVEKDLHSAKFGYKVVTVVLTVVIFLLEFFFRHKGGTP